MPKFAHTDMIEVYHIKSFPQMVTLSTAGSFSVQTVGIALRSTDTSIGVTLEFEPLNYSACFLPLIGPNMSIRWDKRSKISFTRVLDISYWQQSTFLARINGVVYSNYIRWVDNYIHQHPIFVPQSICSGLDVLSCFTAGQTWDSFLTDSLLLLSQLSVQMHAMIPPRAAELQFIAAEPVRFLPARGVEAKGQDLSSDETIDPANISTAYLQRYYSNLLSCMSGYQLESYTSALRSCTPESGPSFVHEQAGQYLLLAPRHPFVVVRDYLQPIPDPVPLLSAAYDPADVAIASALLVGALVGFALMFYKLYCFEWMLRNFNVAHAPKIHHPLSSNRASSAELVSIFHARQLADDLPAEDMQSVINMDRREP